MTSPSTGERPAAPSKRTLSIEGEMTIFRAVELKQLLAARADADEIDLSAVSEFDTAGVQLLLMQQRVLARSGAALRLVAASAAVRELLELYGLGSQFDAAAAEAGA